MYLKELTFLLENCDIITIPGKYVAEFNVSKIATNISRVACNSFMEQNVAHEVCIEIHADANEKYAELGVESSDEMKYKFDRLVEWPDITSIEFTMAEGYWGEPSPFGKEDKKYEFFVTWQGESEYENAAQHAVVSSFGHLYLVISDDRTLDDVFSEDYREDVEAVDLRMRMYNVGNANNAEWDRVAEDEAHYEEVASYNRGYEQALQDINTPKDVLISRWNPSRCPSCGMSFYPEFEDCNDGYYSRPVALERCPYCGQKLGWNLAGDD